MYTHTQMRPMNAKETWSGMIHSIAHFRLRHRWSLWTVCFSCFLSHFFAGIIHRCHRLFRSTFFAAPSSNSGVKPVISEWIVAISEWIEPCSDIADFISTLAAVAAMVESGDLLDGKWGLVTFPVFPPQTYTKQTKQTELPGRCRPCKLILGGTWGYFPVNMRSVGESGFSVMKSGFWKTWQFFPMFAMFDPCGGGGFCEKDPELDRQALRSGGVFRCPLRNESSYHHWMSSGGLDPWPLDPRKTRSFLKTCV